jgi:uncharacterized membrane protein YvlD (DUF360 family)
MAYHYLWPEVEMLQHILVSWLVSALALWIVAQMIPGIRLRGFGSALVATIVTSVLRHMIFMPGRAWTTL